MINIFVAMYFDAHTHNLHAGINAVVQCESGIELNHYYSVGIHPWHADPAYLETEMINLRLNAMHPNCLAIGETGLDKTSNIELSAQIVAFEEQIKLSEELELPLILHCVRAWPEVLEIRKRINPKQTWIFHGFAKHALTDEILKENILLSFGKALFENPLLGEALKKIPIEKILVETDNSGLNISEIYKIASKIRSMNEVVLEDKIALNFTRIFKKWQIG